MMRVDARAGAAVVGARLEGDVERGAPGRLTGRRERGDLGVGPPGLAGWPRRRCGRRRSG